MARRDDLRLLAANVATNFVLSGDRIESENDPDRSVGPRVFVGGCANGNIVRVHRDLSGAAARAVADCIASEAPWPNPRIAPRFLEEISAILAHESPVESATPGLIYQLPHGRAPVSDVKIVRSETRAGETMLARLAEKGMPRTLVKAGFAGVGDLWAPWCAALEGEEIAAVGFAARLGPLGAEIGLFTVPAYRGRGLATLLTAVWSSLDSLEDRDLFYSTLTTNRASVRVAERLGLRRLGAGVRIY